MVIANNIAPDTAAESLMNEFAGIKTEILQIEPTAIEYL